MTPDWWTEAHSATLERRALDPADELGLDFAEHIGAPDGATRDGGSRASLGRRRHGGAA